MWAALVALLLHCDAEGRCYPSLTTIAKVAGLERRTLTKALKALDDAGVIRRERHGRTRTRYLVLLGADAPLALGAGKTLEVGADKAAGRGESVSEVGADTPPELRVLNSDNSQTSTIRWEALD
jgi:DNA-binding transcriptional ArsR family regulator